MPHIVEPTAKVLGPTSVVAGPYRMVFDKECGIARYGSPGAGDRNGYVYTAANFSLFRPSGAWRRVVCLTRTPKILPESLEGESYVTLSGPKPNWRDSFSFTSQVPTGWRGKRIEVEGELRETAAETYTAMFGGVQVARLNGIDNRASVVVQAPQTVGLAHGVRVTLRPQLVPQATLPLAIEWDERAVASGGRGGPVTLEDIGTNIAWGDGYRGEGQSGNARSITLDLGGVLKAEGKQNVEVTFTLVKTLRAHPYRVPLTLKWVAEKSG